MSSLIKVVTANEPKTLRFDEIPEFAFFRERGQSAIRMKLPGMQLWIQNGTASLDLDSGHAGDARYVLLDVEIHVSEM